MENTPYFEDILAEPKALHAVLDGFNPDLLGSLPRDLKQGKFDRIVITGMGASTAGTYPAWLILARAGLPVYWVETSELIYNCPELITARTLLWVVSNSGESTEIKRLINQLPDRKPLFVLANTNQPQSALAKVASLNIPLFSGPDLTVSSRSYLATLAVTQLIALVLSGQSTATALEDLRLTTRGIEMYLAVWQARLEEIAQKAGNVDRLVIVGRGSSYATVMEASLLLKEGMKVQAEGLTTGQFWHGPLEVLDSSYTVVFVGGDNPASAEDQEMALKLVPTGPRVLWLSPQAHPTLPTLPTPAGRGIGLPLVEILPFQLLVLHISRLKGITPADFHYLYKIIDTRAD
jgi:glutamine---fructose-6-phosphate transaminase (isomerizing)